MRIISFFMLTVATLVSCNSPAQKTVAPADHAIFEIVKSDAAWQAELSPATYNVMRRNATERAFSSPLNDHYKPGIYVCAACDAPLFESNHKYDSGTGWPSFDRAIEGSVAYSIERHMGNAITEEHCAKCGGHIGHVFDDGPEITTGKRHCTNGVALKFIPKDEETK